MTISNATGENLYNGNGSTATYSYTFKIDAATELVVTETDATGATRALTYGVDYTVTGVGVASGGTVTRTAGVLPSNYRWSIASLLALLQDTSIKNQGGFFPDVIERTLDRLTRMVQQVSRKLGRQLSIPDTESSIGSLPTAAARAGMFLAFDAAGNPIPSTPATAAVPITSLVLSIDTVAALKGILAPTSGVLYQTRGYYASGDAGAGVYRWNAADTTADNGGTVLQLTAGGTGRWNLVVGWSPISVKQFGAKGDGATDDTAAFTAALACGYPIFAPPPSVAYIVGDVPVPSGTALFGRTTAGYGAASANSTIIRRKAGCTAIFNCVGVGNFNDLTIDGVDLTCIGFGGAKGANLTNCYVQFCTSGMGAGGATYINTFAQSCVFYGNNYGITNMRDSRAVNCTFAANKFAGILLLAGANDNMICGCKIEWNEGTGINFTGATHNTVSGCVIDRNFSSGLLFQASSNNNVVSGCVMRRNGRNDNAPSTADAHFVINSCSDITITGCTTLVGKDDDGSHANTPKYIIQFNNTNVNIQAVGNDFSGWLTAAFAFNATKPTLWVQRDNIGVNGEEIGTLTQASGGRNYLARFPAVSAAAAASPTIGTVTDTGISTFARTIRTMTVYARDSTAGTTKSATFRLLTVREGGSASISCGTVFGEFGTAGSIGVGSGTVLNISFANIATDGSTFDIVATNNSANTQAVTIEIT